MIFIHISKFSLKMYENQKNSYLLSNSLIRALDYMPCIREPLGMAMDYVDKRGAMDKSMDRESLSADLSTAP